MADPYLAPVVYTGKRFVLRQAGLPVTSVEHMRARGYSVDFMLELYPAMVREELVAYLDDDAAETESMCYARADASDYGERMEAARLRRLAARG